MRPLLTLILVAAGLALAACSGDDDGDDDGATPAEQPPGGALELSSNPDWPDGGEIAVELTCEESDTAPPPKLRWGGVPDDAAELALTVIDPDTPSGEFGHWGVAAIAPIATGIDGAVPSGSIEVANDLGTNRYLPPCPPEGDDPHRYLVTLYALGDELGIGTDASVGELDDAASEAAIASTTLSATFGR